MTRETTAIVKEVTEAVEAAVDKDIARLRTLDPHQRSQWIASACETAVAIERSRVAAGLPPSQPAPWPRSTWEFLHTSRGLK
jgi:hypothetical protein